jgi:tRNA(fMet)-specific endonuclease VapC
MAETLLLDTNAVIAVMKGDSAILERLTNVGMLVSSITLGEIFLGAYKSVRVKANLARIEAFVADYVTGDAVLACDYQTARQYGRIKSLLHTKGHPIPDNDIWIAAVALQYGLKLLTRDQHFREVDDLQVANW